MHSLCTKIAILPERQCKDTTSALRKYPHGSASFRMVPKSSDLFHIYFSFLVGAGFAYPNNMANDMGGQTPPLRRASLGEIMGYPIQNEHISHISFFVSKNKHTFASNYRHFSQSGTFHSAEVAFSAANI